MTIPTKEELLALDDDTLNKLILEQAEILILNRTKKERDELLDKYGGFMAYSEEVKKAMAELQGTGVVVYAKRDRIAVFPTWEEAWIYINIERNKGTFEGPFQIVETLADIMPTEEDLVTIKTHIRRYPT